MALARMPLGAPLERHLLGERDHRGLGGRVDADAGRVRQCGRRRQVHDGAAARVDHLRGESPATANSTPRSSPRSRRGVVGRRVEERVEAPDAGVVDQDVAAFERGRQCLDRCPVGDVALRRGAADRRGGGGRGSPSRSTATTSWPSWASRAAVAWPSPRPAPVTTAMPMVPPAARVGAGCRRACRTVAELRSGAHDDRSDAAAAGLLRTRPVPASASSCSRPLRRPPRPAAVPPSSVAPAVDRAVVTTAPPVTAAGLVGRDPVGHTSVQRRARSRRTSSAEISGVVASRRVGRVVWVHNDSGATATVYAIEWPGRAGDASRSSGRDRGRLGGHRGGPRARRRSAVPVRGRHRGQRRIARPRGDLSLPRARSRRGVGDRRRDHPALSRSRARRRSVRGRSATGRLVHDHEGVAASHRRCSAWPKPGPGSSTRGARGGGHGRGAPRPTSPALTSRPTARALAIRTYLSRCGSTPMTDGDVAAALASVACVGPFVVEAQGEAIAFRADGRAMITISEGDHPAINLITLTVRAGCCSEHVFVTVGGGLQQPGCAVAGDRTGPVRPRPAPRAAVEPTRECRPGGRRRRQPGMVAQARALRAAALDRRARRPRTVVPYAELHCHSNFSFLDGASHPEELVEEAARLGLEGLALTDHNGFYGVVRFAEAARAHGLPTVFGAELTLGIDAARTEPGRPIPHGRAPGGAGARPGGLRPPRPCDQRGADGGGEGRAARHARSAHRDRRRPVASSADHWVVLTGCRKGAVPAALERDGPRGGRRALDDLVAALRARQRGGRVVGSRPSARLGPQRRAGRARGRCAASRSWPPTTCTTTARRGAGWPRRSPRCAPGAASTTSTAGCPRRRAPTCARAPSSSRASPATRAWSSAAAHRSRVRVRSHARGPEPAAVPVPARRSTRWRYLRQVTEQGARRAVRPAPPTSACRGAYAQIDHELGLIEQLGFPRLLPRRVGHRRVLPARRHLLPGSRVGRQLGGLLRARHHQRRCGRARAAVRTVPVARTRRSARHRHRHRERPSRRGHPVRLREARPPSRRAGRQRHHLPGQVVGARHGQGARLRDRPAGRVREGGRSAGRPVPASRRDIPADVLELAREIEHFPRHLGIHSGGMVICDRPVIEVCPVEWGRMENRSVLQWDKDDCAAVGLVKFDLLGLGMLERAALRRRLSSASTTGVEVDLATIPQEDEVYDMLCEADTIGVFQVESRAQMATLAPAAAPHLLRPRRRGRAHPPGPHPGWVGAPLHPPPQRPGAGHLPAPVARDSRWRRPSACRCSRSSSCRWPSTSPGSARARPISCARPWDPSAARSAWSDCGSSCTRAWPSVASPATSPIRST